MTPIKPSITLKVPDDLNDEDYAWVKMHLKLAGQECIRSVSEISTKGMRDPPSNSWITFERI